VAIVNLLANGIVLGGWVGVLIVVVLILIGVYIIRRL
jgi:hypothetical protein